MFLAKHFSGATTLSIITLSIVVLFATLSVTTFITIGLFATISISDTQHKCIVPSAVMPSVDMLNVMAPF